MNNTCWKFGKPLVLALFCTAAAVGFNTYAAEFKEELHQTYALANDGRLSLGNVNGGIRIEAWDKAEVKLDAVKKAKKQADLEEVKIEIESKPDRLSIKTKYPKSWNGRSNNTSVDYTLMVPKGVRLDEVASVNGSVDISAVEGKVHASTVNGALNARGLASEAKLSTVNGALKAAFVKFDVANASVSTVNGQVQLDLPANANADLSISTVNGSISGDVPVKKNWPIGREVKTRLGDGGGSIKGSTVNGAVKVNVVKG